MSEEESMIPYFFQRAVDTERITLTPPREGARPYRQALIRLDCLWLIAQAYRAYTGCAAPAWQAYWVAITWPRRPTFPARAGMNRR